MGALRDIVIAGLLLGGIYALVAMGMSLQYGVARVLNVAHGEFIMVGAFITFWLFTNVKVTGPFSWVTNPLFTWVIGGILMFVIGFILYKTMFRHLMRKSPNLDAFEGKSLLATFGLLYVVQNIAIKIWGSDIEGYSYLMTSVTAANIPVNRLVALGFVVVLAAVFYVFLAFTRLGKAIRASAQDPTTSGLMGVNIDTVLAICFGLGLAMAAVAGSLLSLAYPNVTTSMGLEYTIYAMIVVVLGGLGSITGSLAGGLILGFVSAVMTYYKPSLIMIAFYAIFVLLLLIRPKGLMGK
jgi:branched-chain amino acid transport system permease protein